MFDQRRVDNGREFYLILNMQELRKESRRNQNISSYRQTPSRKLFPCFVFCLFACLFLLAILWLNSLF